MKYFRELLTELHEALSIADDQAAYAVADRISGKDEPLGRELKKRVKNFQYLELIKLIERVSV